MGYSNDQLSLLSTLTRTSASLSLLGVAGIAWLRFNRSHLFDNTMGNLIIALTVADGLDALGRFGARWPLDNFGGTLLGSAWCTAQAISIQEFSPASAYISLVMAISMVYIVFFQGSARTLDRIMPLMIAACFVAPLPFVLAVLFYKPDGVTGMVGDADLYCWISRDYSDYRILWLYIPIWIAFVGSVLAYGLTWYRVRSLQATLTATRKRMTVLSTVGKAAGASGMDRYQTVLAKRMMWFVAAFCIIWFPATVNRMTQAATGSGMFALGIAQAILNSLGGFINFVIMVAHSSQRDTGSGGSSPPASQTASTMSVVLTVSSNGIYPAAAASSKAQHSNGGSQRHAKPFHNSQFMQASSIQSPPRVYGQMPSPHMTGSTEYDQRFDSDAMTMAGGQETWEWTPPTHSVLSAMDSEAGLFPIPASMADGQTEWQHWQLARPPPMPMPMLIAPLPAAAVFGHGHGQQHAHPIVHRSASPRREMDRQ
ncbi:hypothetical protein BC831DRAFT_450902 [Entophlyctis helioformis]|nr:hypothetical protein BC831DRAFT_450902 [Entophlyctis helioformis]